MLNHAQEWPPHNLFGGSMDSWPLIISFSAIAVAIFAYGFLVAV
jgi:hypothetical protein